MSIKHAILGLLTSGPLHGYELKTAYEDELVPGAQLNFGQVYKSLERLSRDGLVSHDVVRQDVRPDKKVYGLTEAGREELDRWIRAPAEISIERRDETFLKLVLARRIDGADPLRVIDTERRACLDRLHDIVGAKARAGHGESELLTEMLLDLASLRLEASIKWLNNCEEALRRQP